MTEEQALFSGLHTLLRDAEIRLQEAEAWARDDPEQASLEMSRFATCIYGAGTEGKRLRKIFETRAR